MQPGYSAAALSAFYLIHDRIGGGKAAERIFFHLEHTKVIPESAAAENCLLAFGATLSQSPSARATSSPSITALPLPEITPYISSLLLCEWTNGTPAPDDRRRAGIQARLPRAAAEIRPVSRQGAPLRRHRSARRLLLQRRRLKRNLRHTGNS